MVPHSRWAVVEECLGRSGLVANYWRFSVEAAGGFVAVDGVRVASGTSLGEASSGVGTTIDAVGSSNLSFVEADERCQRARVENCQQHPAKLWDDLMRQMKLVQNPTRRFVTAD